MIPRLRFRTLPRSELHWHVKFSTRRSPLYILICIALALAKERLGPFFSFSLLRGTRLTAPKRKDEDAALAAVHRLVFGPLRTSLSLLDLIFFNAPEVPVQKKGKVREVKVGEQQGRRMVRESWWSLATQVERRLRLRVCGVQ